MERPADRDAVRLGARVVLAGMVFVASGVLAVGVLAFLSVEALLSPGSLERGAPRALLAAALGLHVVAALALTWAVGTGRRWQLPGFLAWTATAVLVVVQLARVGVHVSPGGVLAAVGLVLPVLLALGWGVWRSSRGTP
jgi:hypothetical protein